MQWRRSCWAPIPTERVAQAQRRDERSLRRKSKSHHHLREASCGGRLADCLKVGHV